ncbi:conserved Plasmodium protein, unknown function [Plasmodium gallinaceum]|uniref:Dynein regulatory complex protein 1 C-terminal domain-containing protein n=1 Tax=Plasmodium gallinaceum TaxID=5849 RepID=A0A1J1GTJ5_PLAGA|nr:conserved Plasmodium protein, unknown function [Plasmodium gallinaceum]CRG95554.1 conserved Plasmodium protein, unknown function [Plasmodium gallinaceum]
MDDLLSISREGRIERRRNRIRKKLNRTDDILDKSENNIKNQNEIEDNNDNEIINKDENQIIYNFKYENIECNLNYDNLKKEIIKDFNEKKSYFLNDLSTKINKEEKPFLEDIKKYVIELSDNHFIMNPYEKSEKLSEELNITYHSDFQNNIVEINNLISKEKETYKKKIEKYFCLLKYKDEKIKKLCQINSKNFSSFINLMRDQIEGYKIYLEDIFNKTRDDLNLKRKCLLNSNKQILEDFIRMRNLNSYNFTDEMKNEKILNDKIKKNHEQNHLNLKIKNELLEKNLKMSIDYTKDINNIIIEKEKNLYNRKLLQQKDNHNLKMINFYKLEINKLREVLLSVKTYYYNYKIKSKKNINELINQYERIKFQFIELQKRQKNYEQNFQKKYSKAWELQKSEANKYIEKLINANKIIHEQVFLKEFYKENCEYLTEENNNLSSTTIKDDEKFKIDVIDKKVSIYEIENVKKLLLQECSFLIDDVEMKEFIKVNKENNNIIYICLFLQNADDEEEKLRKILKCIGVYNQNDLELLTQLFYIDDYEEKGEKEELKRREKSLCDNREYTLDIIFKYYQEKEKENLCRITKNKQKYKNRLNISLKLVIERKKQEKEYWNNLSRIIPDDMIKLWKTFLIFVEKYYYILKERENIIKNIFMEEKLIKENLNKINEMNESIKKL